MYVLSRNMKNIRFFLSENFQFLVVKFSIYLNRRVFVIWKLYRYLQVSTLILICCRIDTSTPVLTSDLPGLILLVDIAQVKTSWLHTCNKFL